MILDEHDPDLMRPQINPHYVGSAYRAGSIIVLTQGSPLVKVHPRTHIHGGLMHSTKIFRNGNSQAVRIPAELSYDRTDIEMQIERIGDELRIRPARRSLSGLMECFAKFSPEFMAEGRGEHNQRERDAI
ncbi:MAG: type II toxin-antitoxin system VapB family antitoxin [Ferrovum myxofaciens]|nr:type II toxin-antitoxin system VapB family antitoxin [Ferrovum myxofaciens]